MFNIPELDDIVITQLLPGDLARCARVNKQWHYAAIPYIWSDLCWLSSRRDKRLLFYDAVLADYQRTLQHQRQNHDGTVTGDQDSIMAAGSSFAKYCPWIRVLPRLSSLMEIFTPGIAELRRGLPQAINKHPTPIELLRPFLNHCSGVKSMDLSLMSSRSDDLWLMMADIIIPRIVKLDIRTYRMKASTCQYVLSRCSVSLTNLYLDTRLSTDQDLMDNEVDEEEVLLDLKDLTIRLYDEKQVLALASFWRRCVHVERLTLVVDPQSNCIQSFSDAIRNHMPHLYEICISNTSRDIALSDEDCSCLIRACPVGLRTVKATSFMCIEARTFVALSIHSETLESLVLHSCSPSSWIYLRPVPTSFLKLRTLVALEEVESEEHNYIPKVSAINAQDFIDIDPDSGTLRPWPCESTLEVLKIRIAGIPRPDIACNVYGEPRQNTPRETFPGQGNWIQSRVYERLSRLTKLKVLWLGRNAVESTFNYVDRDDVDEIRYMDIISDHHYDCLEMSLASGLSQLESLQELQDLNIRLMEMNIGLEEAQWIGEHWLKLQTLRVDARRLEVKEWIERKWPHIEVQMV